MKTIQSLILVCVSIAFVNGHGWLTDPKNRINVKLSWNAPADWARSNGLFDQYYYRGGEPHICGGGVDENLNAAYTGPSQATYLSGQLVNMTATFQAAHNQGFMRLKLCKLRNNKDINTRDCFNQNRIKIKPVSWLWAPKSWLPPKNFQDYLILDDYSFKVPSTVSETNEYKIGDLVPETKNSDIWIVTFTAQLPPGLTCDNCVLLWEWSRGIRSFAPCKFENGTDVPTNWDPKLQDWPCIEEQWRSCSDIKIKPDPNKNDVYTPNPVPVNSYHSYPKVFQCLNLYGTISNGLYPGEPQRNKEYLSQRTKNMNPDPLKFIGDGIKCFIKYNETSNRDISGICNTCRVNCMSPGKTCPDNCWCRWYERNPKAYLQTIPDNKWNSDLTGFLTYA